MQTAPVLDANGACLECRVRVWMQTAPVLDADGMCHGCRWRLSWRQSSPVLDADSASASVAHRSCSRASCSRAIAHITQRVAQRVAHVRVTHVALRVAQARVAHLSRCSASWIQMALVWMHSSPVSLGAQDAIIVAEALALVCVGVSIGHILAGRDVVWFS